MANVGQRARVAYAVAARQAADYARGLVLDTSTPMLPGERIRAARQLRVLTLSVVDRAVLVERAAGVSWAEVAGALGLPEQETRRRYQPAYDAFIAGHPAGFDGGLDIAHPDADLDGTAAALDLWCHRHTEPWEERVADSPAGPVSSALAD